MPPTDARFRLDIKKWEECDVERADAEKDRLEKLNASRWQFETYEPVFFNKVGENIDGQMKYKYYPKDQKYWELREQGDWSQCTKIYDDISDDQKPF